MQNHPVIIHRIANAVYARYAGDYYGVVALEQRLGRRQAHLLDVLVYARILLYEQVAGRYISFRLVIIVIGYKVLDGIFRKELAHFSIELSRQRFVRRHDDRRTAQPRDHVSHGEGFAGPCHTQQRLERKTVLYSFNQLIDSLGLIAGRRKYLMQLVRTIGEGNDHRYNFRFGYFLIFLITS